jgi:hypothetical protein
MMMNKLFSFFLLLLLITSCYRVSNKIEPKMVTPVSEAFIKSLKNPFPPLTMEEKREGWGQEYTIALAFAKKMDLYQAISNFKRADILIPPENEARKQEIQYFILLCYYLGMKYQSVTQSFEESLLPTADPSFPAFHDLLIILFHSYKETKEYEKADKIKEVINDSFSESGDQLTLSQALLDADLKKIDEMAKTPTYNYLSSFLSLYESKKKSIPRAQVLNAFIPGLGYFYLGQKRSALTSFLLNGLFIYATYEFFNRGYIGAGIITLSFEMGWYFGGIYGGGEAAKFYNERLYDEEASKLMSAKKIYPLFMLRYAF